MHPRTSVSDFHFACSPTVGSAVSWRSFTLFNHPLNVTGLITTAIVTTGERRERIERSLSENADRSVPFPFFPSFCVLVRVNARWVVSSFNKLQRTVRGKIAFFLADSFVDAFARDECSRLWILSLISWDWLKWLKKRLYWVCWS